MSSFDWVEFLTGTVRMSLDGKEFVAGGVGGIAGVLVGKPFDTIKVRMQVTPEQFQGSTMNAVKHIHVKEGFRGFYKGVMSPVTGQAFINAIVFGVHGNVLKHITNDPTSISANFVAGFAAGCAQTPICCPVELIRIRMETDNLRKVPRYTGTYDCVLKTCKNGGVSSVFRGFNTTMLRESFSFACCFASYEWITLQMKHFTHADRDSKLTTPYILVAGGLAGMITWISTYPIDVIKTCIQEPAAPKYKSFYDCTKNCYKMGGLGFFFRGIVPCLARAFPVNAATFAAYEGMKRLFRANEETPILSLSEYLHGSPLQGASKDKP